MPAGAHRTRSRQPLRSGHGFTLIELVITIAVGSVVVAFMALFIVMPMNAYTAQTRRASLVDASDSALRFMARDLRSALPNSVRIASGGTITALELLATTDGARYQDSGPLANPALALDFTAPDGAFATTVPFTQLTLPWTSSAYYLVIYNVGVPGANAYQMSNVITPAGTTITISAGASPNQNLVTLSPAFQFAFGSPGKRIYLVSGPVSYLCDTAAGTLTRYSGYAIASAQPVSAATLAGAGATSALVAADVGGCQFTYSPGTAQRNALATLSLQITQSGESVQLLHEVQVVNAP
ncbi:MAG TPA: prepilin-type N-terminal cleavage/methylation domain-containing protein [Steroidobacteraceae bacterium]|nr:prepilin-type N-terminal cleavage/methylation domain-containing protein [Steroidobacteraceae bacterium]